MSEYTEVEKPLLKQLEALGWTVIDQGEGIPEDPTKSLRETFHQFYLPEVLSRKLKDLNPWMNPAQIETWAKKAVSITEHSLINRNEVAYQRLIEPLMERDETTHEDKPVRLIDFKNVNNNEFIAINQFRLEVPGTTKGIRPDTVLFINGLAFVVIESKQPIAGTNPVEDAIEQILRYSNQRSADKSGLKEGCEDLFLYNAFNIATCRENAMFGTVCATSRHYYKWTDPYPIDAKGMNAQEIIVQSMCEPARLLDLIENFSAVIEEDDFKFRVVARHQQYRAVIKAIDRLRTEKGLDRSGIFWHTTGSGKSITMMFLVRKLRKLDDLKDFKVIIVVDRNDLEDQLIDTAKVANETVTNVSSRNELDKLSTSTPNLNLLMVHKFGDNVSHQGIRSTLGLPEVVTYQAFGEINSSDRIIVIVDEAHRTQGSSLGNNLAAAFPNAVRYGFTGTPLLKGAKRTTGKFGTYLDVYTPRESINDGTTVPLKYLGKTVNSSVAGRIGLKKDFENLVSGLDNETRNRIVQKYGNMDAYLEAPERIAEIARDIVEHYVQTIFPNRFKAQIITSSKLAAHNYRLAIDEAIKDKVAELAAEGECEKSEEIAKLLSAVVVSSDGTNEDARILTERQRSREMNAIDNFKKKFNPEKPETYLAFLIVCDMLTTGFDAPIEQALYLDKNLKEHTLLQAIARANRVMEGKTYGLVVDYIGVLANLSEALAMYEDEAKQEILEGIQSIESDVPLAESRMNLIVQFFNRKNVSGVLDFLNQNDRAIDAQSVQELMIQALEVKADRDGFNVLARNFFQSVDMLMPSAAAQQFMPATRRLGTVIALARERYREEMTSITWAGAKVKELIDKHIRSEGVEVAIEPVDILSDAFTAQLERQPGKGAQAATMKHAITHRARIGVENDPGFYKPLLEKVEELISKYNENWDELIKNFEDLIEQIRQHEQNVLSGQVDPIDAALAMEMGVNLAQSSPEKQAKFADIKNRLAEITKSVAGFQTDASANSMFRKEIVAKACNDLAEAGLIEDFEQGEKLVYQFLKFYVQRKS
jgi:type I restriction enzyme, R subunit